MLPSARARSAELDPAILAVIGVALSGLMSLAGVVYTVRASRRAAEETAELEERKVDASAYAAARATWAEHVESLQGQVRELRARVTELEDLESRCERRNIELARYSRGLMRLLTAHEIEHPAWPPGA